MALHGSHDARVVLVDDFHLGVNAGLQRALMQRQGGRGQVVVFPLQRGKASLLVARVVFRVWHGNILLAGEVARRGVWAFAHCT